MRSSNNLRIVTKVFSEIFTKTLDFLKNRFMLRGAKQPAEPEVQRSKETEMSVSKAQVEKAAGALGVEDIYVGVTGRGYLVEAYTPEGKVWKDTGVHTLVEWWGTNPAGCRAEALRRIQKGVEKCEQADCDICEGW
jgi:hypothetical protein